jgi:hypothetical protein
MKYILSFLLCCSALAQQTVNNFAVKTNLTVSGAQAATKVNTVADLIALTPVQDGMLVQTLGRNAAGDGGGATFRFVAGSTTSTNLGTVFATTSSPATGRFIWTGGIEIDVRAFGAGADDAKIDTDSIRSAIAEVESSRIRLAWPAGVFLIDGSITNTRSEWAGVRTEHIRVGSVFNTVIKTTNWNTVSNPMAVLFSPQGPSLGAPWIHDMQFQGQQTNTIAKLPIVSVASATQFSVSTNTSTVMIPSASQTNVWPYYGFVFFYSPQGHFIGRSIATDITVSGANYVVTLAPDTLWYATKTISPNILTTDMFAVFSPTINVSGVLRSDPTGAGVRGIEMTGSFGGKLENVGVSGFHTCIAFTPSNGTQTHMLFDIFASDFAFAGFASSTRAFNSAYDYVGNGYLFATGFKSPTGTDLTLTNGGFVSGGFGFYNIPIISKYDMVWSDGCVIGQFFDNAGAVQTDYLLSDNSILHGLMVQDGFAAGGPVKSIYYSSARLRSLGPGLEKYQVDQSGYGIWVRGTQNTANLSFGQLEINPGGVENFAFGFNITNAIQHRVYVGHLADSTGYTNSTGAGTLPPIITRTDIDPATIRYTGMHYGATNLLYTIVNGVDRGFVSAGRYRWLTPSGTLTLGFDSDGLFVGSSTNYTGALTSDGARAVFHNPTGNSIVNTVANGGACVFQGYTSLGTAAAPTAVGLNTALASFQAKAYNGSSYQTTSRILMVSEELQTPSAQGTRIEFETTPIGSTTRAVAMQVRGSGQVQVGTGGMTVSGATTLGSAGTSTVRLRHGRSTLGAGGSVVVSDANVTTNTRIILSVYTPGGVQGFLSTGTRVAGTSFTISSTSATDTSVVDWASFEP